MRFAKTIMQSVFSKWRSRNAIDEFDHSFVATEVNTYNQLMAHGAAASHIADANSLGSARILDDIYVEELAEVYTAMSDDEIRRIITRYAENKYLGGAERILSNDFFGNTALLSELSYEKEPELFDTLRWWQALNYGVDVDVNTWEPEPDPEPYTWKTTVYEEIDGFLYRVTYDAFPTHGGPIQHYAIRASHYPISSGAPAIYSHPFNIVTLSEFHEEVRKIEEKFEEYKATIESQLVKDTTDTPPVSVPVGGSDDGAPTNTQVLRDPNSLIKQVESNGNTKVLSNGTTVSDLKIGEDEITVIGHTGGGKTVVKTEESGDETIVAVSETGEVIGGYQTIQGIPWVPVIYDLDSDGVRLQFGQNTFFDIDSDGYEERIGWVDGSDAILVIDLDEQGNLGAPDGKITSINEFVLSEWVDHRATDLEALAVAVDQNGRNIFDSNNDGKLNAEDGEVWHSFRMWVDKDADAKSSPSELISLEDLGISQIGLKYTDGSDPRISHVQQELNGFKIFGFSDIIVNGETRLGDIWDVGMQADPIGHIIERGDGYEDIIGENGSISRFLILDENERNYDSVSDLETVVGIIGGEDENRIDFGSWGTRSAYAVGMGGDDSIFGGQGFDTLIGSSGSDQIDGGAGDDTIQFDEFDSFVSGGEGRDTAIYVGYSDISFDLDANNFEVYEGNDANEIVFVSDSENASGSSLQQGSYLIRGFGGNDSLSGGGSSDTLEGGIGNDSISGGLGQDSLFGNDGHDFISGGNSADLIDGGSGNDSILGDLGADTIRGGEGFDLVDYSTSVEGVIVRLVNGTGVYGLAEGDSLSSIEAVKGSLLGANDITGNEGDNYIHGGNASDTLRGGVGHDTLFGDDGNDSLSGWYGNDEVHGGEGDDTLTGLWGDNQLYGEDGDDELTVRGGDNYLDGGDGNDTVSVANSTEEINSTLVGGEGDDILSTSGGMATVDGGDGFDTVAFYVYGSGLGSYVRGDEVGGYILSTDVPDIGLSQVVARNVEVVRGTNEDDIFEGTGGFDRYFGRYGDDQFFSDGSNSFFDGDRGYDSISFEDAQFGVAVFQTDPGVEVSGSLSVSSVESIIGSNFDDFIMGSDHAHETIFASAGNDTIDAGVGWDYIYGGSGDDLIILNRTNPNSNFYHWQAISGGVGTDTISFEGLGASVKVSMRVGAADIFIRQSDGDWREFVDVTGFESAIGSNVHGDYLVGSSSGNKLQGLGGDDSLLGMDGDDRIEGGSGHDQLFGGDGADSLFGSHGHDTLDGGEGNDVLHSGSGDNVIDGGQGDDTVYVEGRGVSSFDGGEGFDVISYAQSTDATHGVTINLANSMSESHWAKDDTIAGFEGAVGTDGGHDHLTGTEGDNLLSGLAGSDTLEGGSGDDILEGGSGDDTLDGGSGDDLLVDYAGVDSFIGGLGNDTVSYEGWYGNTDTPEKVLVVDLAGDAQNTSGDTLEGIENLIGSLLHGDRLIGDSGNNALGGLGGDDTLEGGSGDDTLDGGSGDDLLVDYAGVDSFIGGLGNDTVSYEGWYGNTDTPEKVLVVDLTGDEQNTSGDTLEGIENLIGSLLHGDRLIGDSGNNALGGLGGDDTLEGGSGDDTLDGGSGDDLLVDYAGVDSFIGGLGNDTVSYEGWYGNTDTPVKVLVVDLTGDEQNTSGDTLEGIENLIGSLLHGDRLIGDGVRNSLSGMGGNDTLEGGAGNDTLNGGNGQDLIYTGSIANNDYGHDTVRAGAGDDTIFGSNGRDSIKGDEGDDWITGGNDGGTADKDFLHGGKGNDTIISGQVSDPNIGREGYGDRILGGYGDDHLTGGKAYDTIEGGHGSDMIRGDEGDDVIFAGSSTTKEWGNDTVYAGSGNDKIYGSDGQNDLYGNDGSDWISGGDDDSTADSDKLYGGDGDDYLISGQIVGPKEGYQHRGDLLDGGSGSDTLVSGMANDTLSGGEGVDEYRFLDRSGVDVITDFDLQFDKIDLSELSARIQSFDALQKEQSSDGVLITTHGGNQFTVLGHQIEELSADHFVL